MSRELRVGYTTGVHASFAFKSALECYLATGLTSKSLTKKMDNDDMDITKGCEIIVTISSNLEALQLNPISHKPYQVDGLSIYAGVGLGVVSKKGLKPPKDYPAINPVPLKAIQDIYQAKDLNSIMMHCSISITNGEELAKQTANSKVGVLGGISILGTTGWVKPISTSAYMDSIEVEIGFVQANGYEQIVLTLGNSSLVYAKEYFDEGQIVEVGNFVYDSFCITRDIDMRHIIFVCGIGKMVKIAQGYKNTHNRFGSIDFELLSQDIENNLKITVDTDSTKTVRGLVSQLKEQHLDVKFYDMIKSKASRVAREWFDDEMQIDFRLI